MLLEYVFVGVRVKHKPLMIRDVGVVHQCLEW